MRGYHMYNPTWDNADTAGMLYVQKFLETAAPHIFVEYATAVNRYRFVCTKCDGKFTFDHGFGVHGEQVEWVLQKFVKAHVHTPEEFKGAQAKLAAAKEDATTKLEVLLRVMNFKDPAATVKEVCSSKCECGESCPCSQHGFGFARPPAHKTGRKFRQ